MAKVYDMMERLDLLTECLQDYTLPASEGHKTLRFRKMSPAVRGAVYLLGRQFCLHQSDARLTVAEALKGAEDEFYELVFKRFYIGQTNRAGVPHPLSPSQFRLALEFLQKGLVAIQNRRCAVPRRQASV